MTSQFQRSQVTAILDGPFLLYSLIPCCLFSPLHNFFILVPDCMCSNPHLQWAFPISEPGFYRLESGDSDDNYFWRLLGAVIQKVLGIVIDGQHGSSWGLERPMFVGYVRSLADTVTTQWCSLLLSRGIGIKPMLPPPLHFPRWFLFNQHPKGKGMQTCYWLANTQWPRYPCRWHCTNCQTVCPSPQSENGEIIIFIQNHGL